MPTVPPDSPFVTARAITVPIIGPTHGAHNSPSPAPISMPPPKPLRFAPPVSLDNGVNKRSVARAHAGMSIDRPNNPSATIANTRSHEVGTARACTAAPAISVANVNEIASLSITPTGRILPTPDYVESTIGSMGSTQGDTIVATPARKTNMISSGVILFYFTNFG